MGLHLTPGDWYADGDTVAVDQGDTRLEIADVTPHYPNDNSNAVLMAHSKVMLELLKESLMALNVTPNKTYRGQRTSNRNDRRDTYQLAAEIDRLLANLGAKP